MPQVEWPVTQRCCGAVFGGVPTSYAVDGAGNGWGQTTGAVSTAFDLDVVSGNPTVLSDGT